MRVRVYDKNTDKYFKSEVYAIINQGWCTQYLVLVPSNEKAYFKLFEYLDKWKGAINPVIVNVITLDVPDSWVEKAGADLLKVKRILKKSKVDLRFDNFIGYSWIFEDSQLLASLITGQSIACDEDESKKVVTAIEGWNYVEDQDDANELLAIFSDFHDSVLKNLTYISGSAIAENGLMSASDSKRQVTMTFDSQWSKPIEMVFEGVIALNLRPAQDNYTSEIFCASIFVNDEIVSFYDEEMTTEQESYEGTWIKAFGLRWRHI